ncbi:MAG: prenyltransferase [Pyrobaculum sp.]
MAKELATALVHSRPRFWLYTAGPFLVGYGAGAADLWSFASPIFIYGFVYFLIFANVFLYGVNDVFDLDTDVHNPKKRGPERHAVGVRKSLAVWAAASAALAAPLFIDTTSAAYVLAFLALSFIYSAPPIRLKSRPFLDSYSNWLYIVPAGLGYYLASGHHMPLWAWAAGVFWTAGMHALSAVPDIEADKAAGVKTVATALGRRGTMAFVALNWLATASILTYVDILLAPSFIYFAIALYLTAAPDRVETWYWRFPLINSAMGAGAFIYATRWIIPGF